MPLPVRYHFYLTLISPIVLLPILQLLVQLRNGAAARRDCGFTKCIEERFKGGKTVRVRQYTNKISIAAAKTRSNEVKVLPLLAQYPDLRVPNMSPSLKVREQPFSTRPYIWNLSNLVVSYVVLKYIPGKSLEKFWPELTEDDKSAVGPA